MVGELQAGDPQWVGPYRLVGRLGVGGMGQVFLGHSAGGRLVAVKVIRPELAGEPGFRARFAHEVAAARNVSGLFTALVVDAAVDGPVPWLATAYVAGPSLAEAIDSQGPLPVGSVLKLAAGLAEGLGAVHAAGVVHRDLKPSNVLLAGDGPRVIDFGISRAAEASVLTQSGTVMGSPGFMSPEQAEGGEVGPASDVFSLGAVLTFAATGQGPFGTGSTPALIYRVVHNQPDTVQLSEPIRAVVERCLAKDPSQRPSTADLLAELGGAQLSAGWLPAALIEALGRYAPPDLVLASDPAGAQAGAVTGEPRVDGSPLSTETSDGPSTVTMAPGRRAPGRRTPTQAADIAKQEGPGDRPPRRKRRYLVWVPVVAVLMAGSAAAALFLPAALGGAAAPRAQSGIGPGAAHSSSAPVGPSSQAAVTTTLHGRFQDTSPRVTYGNWQGVTDPHARGGTYRQDAFATGHAQFTFSGTAVTWTTIKGPDKGIASVTIDGVSKGKWDLYSPTRVFGSVHFIGLSSGPHTIKITVTGTKNSASSGYYVPIDSFIVGTTEWQDTSPMITYGWWAGKWSTSASGGTYRSTTSAGPASFTFTGRRVEWITATGPPDGKAEVYLDGVDRGTVDLYSTATHWQIAKSYTASRRGQHTLTIQALAQKNAASTGTAVIIDAFKTR